jgi:Family of unknown function (DUF6064)
MGLPFTPEQFFGIFAEYNRLFWLVVVALWLSSAWVLVRAWRNPAGQSRTLSFLLGALWLWSAVAYHAFLFTRINPAAWMFSALFVVQAVLFFGAGARRQVSYFSSTGTLRAIGLGLVSYSLAYPFLSVALGHSYPATPTFGLPCPTAILTIGVLVTARGGARMTLTIVPVFWSFVGGSAAVLLAVPTDYVLLGAGVLLTVILLEQRMRPSPVLR